MNNKSTYYKILGIDKSASKDQIKEAYKKLAFKYHPDKNQNNPFYEECFKKVNEAYQTLSDEKKRAVYDSKLNYAQLLNRKNYSSSYKKTIHISGLNQTIIIITFFSIVILGSIILNYFMNNFSARTSYNEAMELIQKGNTFTALEKLSEAIEFDDKYSEAYFKRGELLILTFNDFRHAFYDFNNAIKFAEDTNAVMYYKRGICNAELGRYQNAIIDFNYSVLLNPKEGKSYYLRALSKLLTGDKKGCCKDLKLAEENGYSDATKIANVDCNY